MVLMRDSVNTGDDDECWQNKRDAFEGLTLNACGARPGAKTVMDCGSSPQ
jgi:hypothetical protein